MTTVVPLESGMPLETLDTRARTPARTNTLTHTLTHTYSHSEHPAKSLGKSGVVKAEDVAADVEVQVQALM